MNENTMQVGAEAISAIKKMAVDAITPKIIDVPGEVDHLQRLWNGKSIEIIRLEPPPRNHQLRTLGSFIEFADRAIKGAHAASDTVLWVGESGLRLILDDNVRRDTVGLSLDHTRQFEAVKGGVLAQHRSQAETIRYLRIDMAGMLPDGNKLLGLLRDMKFQSAANGQANIQHGRESMGKEINAEVLGIEAIPEEVTLSVRVFETPDVEVKMDVKCAIDIFVQEQRFRIIPLPMEVERAESATMDHIMDILKNLQCPTYRGCP